MGELAQAGRRVGDADLGKEIQRAGAGSPAGVRSRAAWAVSRSLFAFFCFFCFFAFFAFLRCFLSSWDDAESSDAIALGQCFSAKNALQQTNLARSEAIDVSRSHR